MYTKGPGLPTKREGTQVPPGLCNNSLQGEPEQESGPKGIPSQVNPCWSDVGKCQKIPCQEREAILPVHV